MTFLKKIMKYKNILLLLLVVCLFSCRQKQTDKNLQIPIFSPLISSNLITDFTQYIDSVEIINLEATDQSYIAYIKKILVDKSKRIIILNSTGILVFSKEGSFLFSIGKNGRGPGEYLQVYDICIDEYSNTLLAVDSDNSVIRYSLTDGQYIEKIIPHFPEKYPNCIGITPSIDNGFFLFGCNPLDKTDFKKSFYCLNKFDKKGKHIESYLLRKDYVFPINIITQSYDNTYLIRPQEGDNICFRIDKGKLKEIYQFDFGKEYIPQHYLPVLPNRNYDIKRYMNSDYYKLPIYLHETKDQMYFSCGGPLANDHFFIFDKANLQGIHWIHDKIDDTPLLLFKASDSEFFYAVFNDYNTYNQQFPPNMEPLKKHLIKHKNINLSGDSMNPLIIKIRFKF